jgi:hypothetical protein
MGMFSWCCKGCGEELNYHELVRLNGQKQVYDGHGGLVFDYSKVSAWHDRCYQQATNEEKLDETFSKSAPNQGAGAAKLENLAGYDSEVETTFSVNVYCFCPEKSYVFYLTNSNKLEDQRDYLIKYEEEAEKLTPSEEDFNNFLKLSDEERDRIYLDHQNKIEVSLGGPMPSRNVKNFTSFADAMKAIDEILDRDLPKELIGDYELFVYGKQGEISGSVYEKIVRKNNVKVSYANQRFCTL